jgi:hypothetical protein
MAKTSKRLDRLANHVGAAIESYSKKHSLSHIEVLRSLETLRFLITEDFVENYPQDVWMLRR